jgi:pyruvate dehydrogenase E2 component (dihydrolipoamide acetyltransferase)
MSTFNLPDLGEGLAEAEIIEWHVKVGDHVRCDQPLVSVETAKAVVEVPAPCSGIVTALRGAPGDILPTGAPLVDFDSGTVVGSMPATSDAEFIEAVTAGGPRGTSGGTRGTSGGTRGTAGGARAGALPAARALARRLSMDLDRVRGTGRAGVITLDDVLRHANVDPQAAAMPARMPAPPADGTMEPLRGARRAMAHSMSQSRDQVAGSTVCDDADIERWTQRGDYLWRIMRAMIAAWRAEPALKSRTPAALRAAVALQKEAAHRRTTAAEDLRDFTILLSNFGTIAGRYAIPLVVPPAVAILGVGKVREDAVAVAGAVQAHPRMPLSLSFDHRCITGGEACRFLGALIADLEQPQ